MGATQLNPWAAAAGAAAQALSGGPSSASGKSTSSFDSSGWNVNFGSGKIDSTRAQTPSGTTGGINEYLPYVAIAAALLIVWRMTKKR